MINIEIDKGFNKSWEVIVKDQDGAVVPITDSKIHFKATKNTESIELKNAANGGSSAQIEDSDPTNGKFKIHFTPSITSSKIAGSYIFGCKIELSGGNSYIVIDGTLKIKRNLFFD